jgi:hypothetical protein
MNYDKKLIDKAKHSRCRICQDEIAESEADSCDFQATKTSRGGTALYIPGVLRRR